MENTPFEMVTFTRGMGCYKIRRLYLGILIPLYCGQVTSRCYVTHNENHAQFRKEGRDVISNLQGRL
jgi:hypothetical protein